MAEKEKPQKSLDKKTEDLWLTNTGQETKEVTKSNTDKVTEKDTKQNTEQDILLKESEQYTERFELKMKPSQMKKLQKLSDKYNKSRAEILRTSLEFLVDKLKNK